MTARVRCGRLARALTATVVATALGGLTPVAAAAQDPTTTSTTRPAGTTTTTSTPSDDAPPTTTTPRTTADTPRIDVVTQTPAVAPDGTFLLTVDVRPVHPDDRLDIVLHTRPLADRAAFSASLFGVGLSERQEGPPPLDLSTFPPDGEGRRRVTVAIALKRRLAGPHPGQIGLRNGLIDAGAYPLELTLRDAEGTPEAKLITHVVRLPEADEPATPLRTALLLDLHADPTIAADGTDTATPETFVDATATATAIAEVPTVPLTVAATPETIEAMDRSGASSRRTVSDLRLGLAGRELLDAPYVDVPLTAWINAGMVDQLNEQRARGSNILNELLTAPDGSTWLAGADLTTTAASKLWEFGVRRLVVRPGSFAAIPPDPDEPTLARPFSVAAAPTTPLSAVAVDTRLQAAFNRQKDPELTAYQTLAELATIEAEAPAEPRGVVLAAPSGWTPSPAFLTTLLNGLATQPLLEPVTLDGLFRDVKPLRSGTDRAGAPVIRPLTPLPAPDLGPYPTDLATIRQKIESFSGMVGPDDSSIAQWNQRLLISGDASFTAAEQHAYLAAIDRSIARQVAGIDASPQQTVTLTSSSGSIPLTLRSRLRRTVHVVVALESSPRLEFPDGNRLEYDLRPGSQQLQVPIKARSPGDTPLTVRVESPDGGLALADTRFTVRSTAVSGIGYVLSGGAALFLVVWWARSWRRSRRDKRTAAAT